MSTPVRGFDFHCHIDLFTDPAATIATCEHHRIVTLAMTTTPKAWTQNRRWMAGNRYMHAAVGLHPELAGERHAEIALLETLLTDTPFIGEIGLDGSRQHRNSWQVQREVFTRALDAAQRLGGRVASIHSRRAAGEVLNCLAANTTSERVLPILHWFSDSIAVAQRAAAHGCYFSINHRMLQTDAGVALVRNLPADRILTETDAPFTEVANRKSEPQDVLMTAEALAVLRGVSEQEMRDILLANARRVFTFAGIGVAFEPDSD